MGVNVEIKNAEGEPGFDTTGGLARQTVSVIHATIEAGDVLVSSFDLATLDVVREADADMATGYLVFSGEEPLDAVALCVERAHQAINPFDFFVTQDSIVRAHDSGIEVNVWTVDDPTRIAELGSWGADSVITNRPALALAALGRA